MARTEIRRRPALAAEAGRRLKELECAAACQDTHSCDDMGATDDEAGGSCCSSPTPPQRCLNLIKNIKKRKRPRPAVRWTTSPRAFIVGSRAEVTDGDVRRSGTITAVDTRNYLCVIEYSDGTDETAFFPDPDIIVEDRMPAKPAAAKKRRAATVEDHDAAAKKRRRVATIDDTTEPDSDTSDDSDSASAGRTSGRGGCFSSSVLCVPTLVAPRMPRLVRPLTDADVLFVPINIAVPAVASVTKSGVVPVVIEMPLAATRRRNKAKKSTFGMMGCPFPDCAMCTAMRAIDAACAAQ